MRTSRSLRLFINNGMSEVKFVDTTLRDGQASLWAENMRTGMMLAVAERMDQAGFQAIELIASSHLKKCVRELREDPFERMRLLARRADCSQIYVCKPGLSLTLEKREAAGSGGVLSD